MSEIVKDPSAPESIWLQTGGDYSVARGSDDLTWSGEEIDDTDEKYVRADIATTLRTRAEEAEARVGELEARDAAMRGVVDAAMDPDFDSYSGSPMESEQEYQARARFNEAVDAYAATKAEG